MDNPEIQIQVFAGEFEDGRKKPRFYLLRGEDKETGLGRKYEANERKPIPARQESDSCSLKHLGSWEEFEEVAENYSYDFYPGYSIPIELSEEIGNEKIRQVKSRAESKSPMNSNREGENP